MAKRERIKKKVCPRCGIKMPEIMTECPECELDFSRFEMATNKDAKRKIKRHDKNYIIKTNKLPSDVKYIRLFLITIFLGWAGGHCFYVGRYLRGAMFALNMLFALICVIFNQQILQLANGAWMEIFGIIIGFVLLVWIYDIWAVGLKRFKVPVAIDLKDEGVEKIK